MLFPLWARRISPVALLFPWVGLAMEPLPSTGPSITLQTAINRSLQRNPELAVHVFDRRAQDGALSQASLAPNPELDLDIEDALGSGDRRGFSAAQTTLSLRQVLERGARERRMAVARAGLSELEARQAELRIDIAAETARRYYRVLAEQEHLRLTNEASTLARRAADAARVRVSAAQAPDAELARAEAQLARARLDEEDVEHELLTARYELAALWGSTSPDFGSAAGDLLRLPAAEAFDALLPQIDANPSLLKFTSLKALREAEVRLAAQKRQSPWTMRAGIRRYEAGDDFAAVAGLSIPFSLRDPARGDVAAAQARLERVGAEYSANVLQVRTQLFGWLQELAHARHTAHTLDDVVIPRMVAALAQTESAYQRGRYGYSELLAAQRELLEVKRARIDVAIDAYRYATEIDRLTGDLPAAAGDSAVRAKTN